MCRRSSIKGGIRWAARLNTIPSHILASGPVGRQTPRPGAGGVVGAPLLRPESHCEGGAASCHARSKEIPTVGSNAKHKVSGMGSAEDVHDGPRASGRWPMAMSAGDRLEHPILGFLRVHAGPLHRRRATSEAAPFGLEMRGCGGLLASHHESCVVMYQIQDEGCLIGYAVLDIIAARIRSSHPAIGNWMRGIPV